MARCVLHRISGAPKRLNIVGADVVEVAPPFDVGGIIALAGATVVCELLCILAQSVTARAAPSPKKTATSMERES
jgi:arginase family enzyme